jgi:hypothetical protein
VHEHPPQIGQKVADWHPGSGVHPLLVPPLPLPLDGTTPLLLPLDPPLLPLAGPPSAEVPPTVPPQSNNAIAVAAATPSAHAARRAPREAKREEGFMDAKHMAEGSVITHTGRGPR